MVPIVIERDSLAPRFLDWGVDLGKVQPLLPKPRYALPSLSWLLGLFARDWSMWRYQVFTGFEQGSEICVDYVRECCCFAARLHRQTADRPKMAGLALGEFFYVPDHGAGAGEGHAVCIALVYTEPAILPVFFDPQPAARVYLTPMEINSCQFVRI